MCVLCWDPPKLSCWGELRVQRGKEITNGVHQVPKKDTGSTCRKEQKRPVRVVRVREETKVRAEMLCDCL